MKYYIPCAKNKLNNRRIQEQKLGSKKGFTNYNEAMLVANTLCEKMNIRQSGDWVPFIKTVTK